MPTPLPTPAALLAGVLLISGPALAIPPVDRDELAKLPQSAQGVVAISDVPALQATRAGQALGRFLQEVGSWDRTRQAWDSLGRALGVAPGEVISRISVGRVLLVGRDLSAAAPMNALLLAVPPEVERRVRERLRPVPLAIQSQVPVLSLEDGAFDVATWLDEGDSTTGQRPHADVLLAPGQSRPLFESLLPALRHKPADLALDQSPAWSRLASLPPGCFEILYQDQPPESLAGPGPRPGSEPLKVFALSSEFDQHTITARFAASPALLDEPAPSAPWPAQAVDLLSPDALLLVAGATPRPDDDASSPIPPGDAPLLTHPERTLLRTMLASLDLPPDLSQHLRGIAIFAAQQPAESGPVSFAAALPIDDLTSLVPRADAFVAERAGAPDLAHPGGPLASAGTQAVRVLSLGAAELPLLGGAFGPGSDGRGVVAWGFVRGQGDAGWWVLRVRGGQDQAPVAVAGVQELCAALAEASDPDDMTVFRLAARPAELVERSAAAHPGGPRNALRWLQGVDTTMRRRPDGDYAGTIRLELNESLLDAATEPRGPVRRR